MKARRGSSKCQLNKKIAEKCSGASELGAGGPLAHGRWPVVDQLETENLKKLPVCSVERWTEVLMKKVSEAAAVGDVFAAQAVRTAQAENQRLLSGRPAT